ncbi:MAG: hypothetical protein JWN62_2976 [Acidimicrobiales bacterium]|nr:hypothetical protein [Acidimicrobiales bacterium]
MFEFEPSLAPDPRCHARRSGLFSDHGHALILVARDRDPSVAELARRMHMSEAAVGDILGDLVARGLVAQMEVGLRTRFVLTAGDPMASAIADARSVAAIDKLYARRAG